MPASSVCEVQNGAGPFVGVVGGINVTPSNTISIRLQSIVDVTQWTLQIFGLDEITVTAPTLTDVNVLTHEVLTPGTVVTFSMPPGVGVGRAILFRSAVNGGGSGFTSTFGVYALTATSLRVGAVGEKFEGDPTFGWATPVNAAIRLGGGGGGLPALTGSQYAVLMEDPGGNLIFQRITDDMILPGFDISSYSKTAPNGGQLLYRRGSTITGVTAAASYTAVPTSATIANTFGGSTNGGDINPGLWTLNTPFVSGTLAGSVLRIGSDLGADPTWTATLSAIKTPLLKQATFTVTWTRDVYYGIDIAGLSTEADIEALAGTTLATGRARTITVSPTTQKVYYSYPKAYGTATFTLNGFPASFLTPSEVPVTNVNGVTSTYYLYESTNLLTGVGLNFIVT